MASNEIFDKLEDYKDVASWLLWDDDNPKGLDWTKTEFDINDKYVFVALNASFKTPDKWGSFHSGKRGDKNIYFAFKKTAYEGCYITDLIKYKSFNGYSNDVFKAPNSKAVVQTVMDNHEIYNRNISIFEKEMESIGNNKTTVLAFGNDVYMMLKFNPNINEKYKIIRLPHFSSRTGYKKYCKEVNKILKSNSLPSIMI